ncbi:hypothetical protein BX616_008191 [Lobosporangium transversale]|nr:hypothetical protein BX616_008191 [Lobosporangium transversale]
MEFYSFQYPPRPIPSDHHRPTRYYFHNLDQDRIIQRKNHQVFFQKEGVPPKVLPITATTITTPTLTSTTTTTSSSSSSTSTPTSAAADCTSLRGISEVRVLDRTKFLIE